MTIKSYYFILNDWVNITKYQQTIKKIAYNITFQLIITFEDVIFIVYYDNDNDVIQWWPRWS